MSTITLQIQYSDGRIEPRQLAPGVYQIGRDMGDIVLGDPNTSARHAELRVEPGRVTVTDLGSTNGTYDAVGSRLSGPYVLQPGGLVKLGLTTLTLVPQGPVAGGTRVMSAGELPAFGSPPGGGARPPMGTPPPTAPYGGSSPGMGNAPPATPFGGSPPGGPPPGAYAPPPGAQQFGTPPGGQQFGGPPPGAYAPPPGAYGSPPQGAPTPGPFGAQPPGAYAPPPGGQQFGTPPGGQQFGTPPGGQQFGTPPGGQQFGTPPGGQQFGAGAYGQPPGPPYGAPPGGSPFAPMGPMGGATTGEDKTAAIIAYITLIGFIAAILMQSNNKTRLGAFHLRQVLGFFVTGVVASISFSILFAILGFIHLGVLALIIWPLYGLGMFVLWVLGILAAVRGEMKPMPVVGEMYQNWFKNMFT